MTLVCPSGMRVAGFQTPEQRLPLTYGLSGDTTLGVSRRARIVFGRATLARAYEVTVGVLCRRPDAGGSLVERPRLARRGERPGRVCARSAYLYRSPGRIFVGTVFGGQPLAIQRRSASGRWVRVVTDARTEGWLRTRALCG